MNICWVIIHPTHHVVFSGLATSKMVAATLAGMSLLLGAIHPARPLLNPCPAEDPPRLLYLIHSAPDHFERRQTLRTTWARDEPGTKRVFVVGRSGRPEIDHRVQRETAAERDVLLYDFPDSYRHLTFKVGAGRHKSSDGDAA